jgi:hypothetical protein
MNMNESEKVELRKVRVILERLKSGQGYTEDLDDAIEIIDYLETTVPEEEVHIKRTTEKVIERLMPVGKQETSAKAAIEARKNVNRNCMKILAALRRSEDGLIDEEGIEVTGISENSYRSPRGILEERRMIVKAGQRETKLGNSANIWKLHPDIATIMVWNLPEVTEKTLREFSQAWVNGARDVDRFEQLLEQESFIQLMRSGILPVPPESLMVENDLMTLREMIKASKKAFTE